MAETMQRLNTLGNVNQPQGQQRQQKSSSKYGGAQVINVTYGHNGSGKLYSYYGTNKRTGDIVTPEVTHPKSGKTYKTLAVVQSTHNAGKGQDTMDYLQGKQPSSLGNNINKQTNMKWIGMADQKSLPGYYQGWEKDAQAAYDLKKETLLRNDISHIQKMSLMCDIAKIRK